VPRPKGDTCDDLIDAVDWAIAQQIADPARVAIMGGSYGGYTALVGLTFTPDKFACAIDLVGISNLVTFLNTIPEYWMTWKLRWKVPVGDYTTEAGLRFLEERSICSGLRGFDAHVVRALADQQRPHDTVGAIEAMTGPGRVSSTYRAGGRRCRPALPVAMASHRRRSLARRCGG
jgi:S-formylglutathione hydrolase FrmB